MPAEPGVFGRTVAYLADHWRGRHALSRALWINLVLLQLALQLAQHLLRPAAGSNYASHALIVVCLAVFVHGGVFFWQAVGVLRASERYVSDYGSMSVVWGVQLLVVVSFFLALNGAIGAWEMTRAASPGEKLQQSAARERAGQYRLEVAAGGMDLRFTGRIVHGATAALDALLAQQPTVRRITLESTGGNVYEARGMSRLIRERQIDTYVRTQCLSACTTVFIGGVRRSLEAGARLGFHQYRIEAAYSVPFVDAHAEQSRDRELYRQAGVAPAFLNRMFERDASDMWLPSAAMLRTVGVITDTPTDTGRSSR